MGDARRKMARHTNGRHCRSAWVPRADSPSLRRWSCDQLQIAKSQCNSFRRGRNYGNWDANGVELFVAGTCGCDAAASFCGWGGAVEHEFGNDVYDFEYEWAYNDEAGDGAYECGYDG